MSSDARINASRANGKLSRGPRTPEGKAVSSKNRVDHGLFIDSVLLPGENQKEFRKVLAREFHEHEPESPVEHQIVQKLALYQWKQMRIWAMQVGGHSGEIRNQEGNQPDILTRDMAYRAYVAYKLSRRPPLHGDPPSLRCLLPPPVSFPEAQDDGAAGPEEKRVNFRTNLDFPNNPYGFAK
jgi:hypothetical protein